jgi:hypothetical protein
VQQVRLGFRNVRLRPGLCQGTQPLDCPVRGNTDLRGLLDLSQRRPQPLHSFEIGLVADAATDVLTHQLDTYWNSTDTIRVR